MNWKWITLIVLIMGGVMASGCATISPQSIAVYNDAKDTFQKATDAGAKKCAPVEYATAEAYLALATHEIDEKDDNVDSNDLATGTKIAKEKSLEALQKTPCDKPAPAPPPPPEPVKPTPPAPAPKKAPMFGSVYFNPNKTNITPASAKALDQAGETLKENPDMKVEIGGHSDNAGSEKANQMNSEKRAMSVKRYLQDKFNIPDSQLVTKGYGSTKPVADNKTEEGRAKNRRVEIRVMP
jgi:outer membrane protein OmpA-like peptidoglycan-associated protein